MSNKSRPPRQVGNGDIAVQLLTKRISESVELAMLAKMVGVNLSTVHRWRMDGKLEGAWRLGGRWWVPASSIHAMIERSTSGASRQATAAQPGQRTDAERRKAADEAMRMIKELV